MDIVERLQAAHKAFNTHPLNDDDFNEAANCIIAGRQAETDANRMADALNKISAYAEPYRDGQGATLDRIAELARAPMSPIHLYTIKEHDAYAEAGRSPERTESNG